jgi:6,7-dimethyl-8-ribityllumazine synthase
MGSGGDRATVPTLAERDVRVTTGRRVGVGGRVVIVAARFNRLVTDRLVAGAVEECVALGVDPGEIEVVWVPGAFELAVVAAEIVRRERPTALVAVGAVVRGETAHFEYVAGPAAQQLQALAVESGVPIGFAVLTTETVDQALDRAGGKAGNKGAEAAATALEVAAVLAELRRRRPMPLAGEAPA